MTTQDYVQALQDSRTHFFKHIAGMTDDQCDWKPYPECKNVRETLAHIVVDDTMALQSLQTGEEPDYDAAQVAERDLPTLRTMLDQSHQALCAYLLAHYADASPDTEICVWGSKKPLALGLPIFSSEDYYHAGQVAFIRQATDPAWDYYTAIYGG